MSAGTADAAANRPRLRPVPQYEPPVEQPGAPARWIPHQPVLAPVADLDLAASAEDPRGVEAAHRLLRAIIEVIAGLRRARQLQPLLAEEPYRLLSRLAGLRQDVALRSVRTCQPAAGVVEATGVYRSGTRLRAIAARLEHAEGTIRWRCTVLGVY